MIRKSEKIEVQLVLGMGYLNRKHPISADIFGAFLNFGDVVDTKKITLQHILPLFFEPKIKIKISIMFAHESNLLKHTH